MNPIVFALRHPITVMVAVVAIVLGSGLAAVAHEDRHLSPASTCRSSTSPSPTAAWTPPRWKGCITNYYEYHFLYINGIHHVESQEHPGRRR